MNPIKSLSILLLFNLVIIRPASSQFNWKLKSSKDSIRVYISDYPESDFKVFKTITTVKNAGLNEIASIILDVAHSERLYPDVRDHQLLVTHSDGHLVHYLQTGLPWPLDDRDGVYQLVSDYSKADKKIHIQIKCLESKLPVKKGVVRMTKGAGFWEIREITNELFEVTYQYHSEPGGDIPSWLVNTSLASVPHQTMVNLKKVIAKGKYKNGRPLDFIK